jgi:membrane-bound metal-dependent hydrolase YbcI (DUF457 family)
MIFGALMYMLFLRNVTYDYFFIAIFFVILPDLDIFLAPLKRKFKSNYLDHRGGSHSYVIGMFASFIISLVYAPLANKSFFVTWIIGSIFYGIHISQDLLTTTKIPYLFPLSKKEKGFYVEKAGSLFTWVNSFIFLIISLLFYVISVNINFYVLLVNFYTIFFIVYYLYRILSKIIVNDQLDENQKYFPGILPFYYYILNKEIENDKISLKLMKKAHFKKAKYILEREVTLNSEELKLFNKADKICKNDYYFAKWTTIPLFIHENGLFSIKMFFVEILNSNKALYIRYDFDFKSQQLIAISQKRGPILDG